ncbi:MAG: hypothetical protein WBP51_19680, partial [Candidatus Sulfotelmatobacter sp.]
VPNHSVSRQLFLPGIIRRFDWLEKPVRETAAAEHYCNNLKSLNKILIINKLLVEATGVELFSVLTARNLLIPGTTAKNAPSLDPLYLYLYEKFFHSGVAAPDTT